MSIKQRFQFSRPKVEFAYSIFIIIFVPALLVFNTLWLLNNTKQDMDSELRRKADLANQAIASSISLNINDEYKVQSILDQIMSNSDEMESINVLVPLGEKFRVMAASDASQVGLEYSDVQSSMVWAKEQSIATLINSASNKEDERLWKVLTPVKLDNKKVALVDSTVSVKDVDELTAATFRQSLIILVATVLAILLLFVNHFRFVEYAMLFKKLKELDEMKSDFLSIATHELKSPMAVISGYIDMVLEQKETKIDEQAEKYLKKALEQTNRLSVLVADLLNVSRIEQGRIKYDMAEVKVNEVIENIMALYTEKAEEKGLKLQYKPMDLPTIWADPGRIQEIFTNLIDNAIKYSERGEVRVEHKIDGNHLVTLVSDDGLGMSVEAQKKLFQRFYRVKTDKTATISGTGLGLWIIKQYIEAMKGSIALNSEEGKGTTFTVSFPTATGLKADMTEDSIAGDNK